MGKRNKDLEKAGLHVAVDREAYPNMFEGPRSLILRGMRGTTIEVGSGSLVGNVKIKFEDAQKVTALQMSTEGEWFLSGALSEVVQEN